MKVCLNNRVWKHCGKGEIALLFPQSFQKSSAAETSKSVCMKDRVLIFESFEFQFIFDVWRKEYNSLTIENICLSNFFITKYLLTCIILNQSNMCIYLGIQISKNVYFLQILLQPMFIFHGPALFLYPK